MFLLLPFFFALKKTDIIMIFKSAHVKECWNTSWMCPDEHWIWFRLQTKSYHQFEKLIIFQNRIKQLFLSYDDVVDLDYVWSFSRKDESLPIRIEKQNMKSHVTHALRMFSFFGIYLVWPKSIDSFDPFHFILSLFSPWIKIKGFIESCQCSYQI